MLRLTLLILTVALGMPAAAQMQYDDADLQRVNERSVPNIRSVFVEDIIRLLPRDLRPKAAGITLAFPRNGPNPLAFYAEPSTQTIYMPLSSIRFFDDVATLFAWFESNSCQPEYLQSYLYSLLRKGRPLPPPLKAFSIDREVALADAYTNDVSTKIFSSGLQFILAHETGHLLLEHTPGVGAAISQQQETAADLFALEHFARLGGVPMGVLWYYMAAWWQDPLTTARDSSSHPVSPERIRALGQRLLSDPMDFSHGENDPAQEAELVRQMGAMVLSLADQIDEDGFLTLLPSEMDRNYPASRFDRACPS